MRARKIFFYYSIVWANVLIMHIGSKFVIGVEVQVQVFVFRLIRWPCVV
jgi:hypothetical protein